MSPLQFQMFWSRRHTRYGRALETDKAGLQILEPPLTVCVALGKLQYFSLPQLTRWKHGIIASNSTDVYSGGQRFKTLIQLKHHEVSSSLKFKWMLNSINFQPYHKKYKTTKILKGKTLLKHKKVKYVFSFWENYSLPWKIILNIKFSF